MTMHQPASYWEDDAGWVAYEDSCSECGEPGVVGCDGSCPALGRRLQAELESAAAAALGRAIYSAARLHWPRGR